MSEKTKPTLEELKQTLASLDDKFKELKGNGEIVTSPDLQSQIWNVCYDMVSNLRNYVYAVEDRMYSKWQDHQLGHLPQILGAERMNNALETLGLDGDFKAEPKTIYASDYKYSIKATKGGVIATLDLTKPKK